MSQRPVHRAPSWAAILFLVACACAATAAQDPADGERRAVREGASGPNGAGEVRVDGGSISGTLTGGGVRVYKGVPYAAPPVGRLRWREPQPADPWQGVREAVRFAPSCPEMREGASTGRESESEDCLYLNLWTAAETPRDRRPVLVWIHGGGLQNGTAAKIGYDGESLARKGVVLVTFNYRINVFGFLAHPTLSAESEHDSSGNYGLLDQIAALHWVRRNIASFGGDPDRVTIFGQSAGSVSVSYLMASPLARGLFQRAIAQSGGAFEPNPYLRRKLPGDEYTFYLNAEAIRKGVKLPEQDPAEAVGRRFFSALGCDQAADPAACARAQPTRALMARAVTVVDGVTLPAYRFIPNVDGWFLPDDVHALFAARRQADVPLIAGFNADEGAQSAQHVAPASPDVYGAGVRLQFGELAGAFLRLYPASSPAEMLASVARRYRDERNTWKMRTWASLMQPMQSKAWLYYFTRTHPGGEKLGAFHGAELPYVFDNLRLLDRPWTDGDRRMSETLSGYWVRFAASGDPNRDGLPSWPSYDAKTARHLEIGDAVVVKAGLHDDAFEFWDRYFAGQRLRRRVDTH